MYSEIVIKQLNEIAYTYRDKIKSEIEKTFSNARFRNTGTGADSLTVEVIEGTATVSPNIIVKVADHMMLLDKRSMSWTKMPPIEQLQTWGENKTFQTIPGYKFGKAPDIPLWKAKQRVMWAIAKSKEKFDTYKRKPWRKPSLSKVLAEMNKEMLLKLAEAYNKDIQQGINNAR